MKQNHRIAILGAGPSGLFIFKRLVASGRKDLSIDIFEKHTTLGAGMPYSKLGANDEHITNVSGNEIPEIVTPIADWIKTVPQETLHRFNINLENFNDYKVLPRLLFGEYLSAQFKLLIQLAKKQGLVVNIYFKSTVEDIIDVPGEKQVLIKVSDGETYAYDYAIISTGHRWPKRFEGKVPGYFDSPYPPSKLALTLNHPVAIKGASLTAIDAIRTLARNNGRFIKDESGKVIYELSENSKAFRLVMHTRNGLLPAIRFHLEDSHLAKTSILSQEEIDANRAENGGFLSLDYIFDKNFKALFKDLDPVFYLKIKEMKMEEFVAEMMELRERLDSFQLFMAEYAEADKSIKRKESVLWKEMLAVLSFAMNYPAKYLSAEDMLRLQQSLMPLISIVIAFVPQSSVEDLLALYRAGVLTLVTVGEDSEMDVLESGGIIYHYIDEQQEKQEVFYKTFVDCVGQPHLSYDDLPFKSLLSNETVSPALLKFKDQAEGLKAFESDGKMVIKDQQGVLYLKVPGIAINDNFQVVDRFNALNERIYMMAVPYMGGYNPDYSGLDFCELASERISKSLLSLCHEK